MRRDSVIFEFQEQVRKLTRELEQILTIRFVMLIILTLHTHPLMKTLIMGKEELEEEGIQGMTLETSRLKPWSLMETSIQKTTYIGFNL